jgi:hypothetical protein
MLSADLDTKRRFGHTVEEPMVTSTFGATVSRRPDEDAVVWRSFFDPPPDVRQVRNAECGEFRCGMVPEALGLGRFDDEFVPSD